MDADDEIVTMRPLPGQPEAMEIRVSCPDATGLGCDVARTFLDFGLKEMQGDFSTDGKWCFLIFQVSLVPGMRPRWSMLKKRLLSILPSVDQSVNQFYLWKEELLTHLEQKQFILQVTSYDRMGYLHDLVNALFECDLACAKAHITTSPSNGVLDVFWICDYKKELPGEGRKEEIINTVKKAIGQPDANITIAAAREDGDEPNQNSVHVRRTAAKDAQPCNPWKKGKASGHHGNGSVLMSQASFHSEREHHSQQLTDGVKVSIDNCTSSSHTVVQICCRDRKGLLYDVMRTIKDSSLRVTYGKVSVKQNGVCFADVFVQEVHGGGINDSYMLHWLVQIVRKSLTSPVKVATRDLYDGLYTELKVTYDVTHALGTLRVCVFMAEIYFEKQEDGSYLQELHRFLLQDPDGHALTDEVKAQVVRLVRANLLGHVVLPGPEAMVNPQQTVSAVSALSDQFAAAAGLTGTVQPQYASKQPAVPQAAIKAPGAVTAGASMTPNLSGWNRKW